MRIDDARFLRQLSRGFCCRSVTGRANARVLAGRTIEVTDFHSDSAGLQVDIVDAQGVLVSLAWCDNRASVLPRTLAGILADDYDDDSLTDFVRLFLRRHGLINKSGFSTRKGVA